MSRIPKARRSTHPGEMLREEFLVPSGITQARLAREIKVPFQRVNEIVSGKRGLTPSTALRLARFFGTSSAFWMNLQMVYDLQVAEIKEAAVLRSIKKATELAPTR
jgi:addiction module HigA family antidote